MRTTVGHLALLFASACYSPTAGWNPPCYAIPAEERTAEGKPRIICRVPETSHDRERAERRADIDSALRRARQQAERADHDQ